MTSLLRFLDPDYEPVATVENLGVAPEPAIKVDVVDFDREIQAAFDQADEYPTDGADTASEAASAQ